MTSEFVRCTYVPSAGTGRSGNPRRRCRRQDRPRRAGSSRPERFSPDPGVHDVEDHRVVGAVDVNAVGRRARVDVQAVALSCPPPVRRQGAARVMVSPVMLESNRIVSASCLRGLVDARCRGARRSPWCRSGLHVVAPVSPVEFDGEGRCRRDSGRAQDEGSRRHRSASGALCPARLQTLFGCDSALPVPTERPFHLPSPFADFAQAP